MYEFIIPARNEAAHIGHIVESMKSALGGNVRILVVDNGSNDNTGGIASEAGADEVIEESTRGKGYAVVSGALAANSDRVFVCDADIAGLDWSIATGMVDRPGGCGPTLVRAHLDRDLAAAPVTSLLAVPMVRALGCEEVDEPLGGVFSVDRSILVGQHLPGGWGFDIGLTLLFLGRGYTVEEIPVCGVSHRTRDLSDYPEMALQVAETVALSTGLSAWDHRDCTRCRGGDGDPIGRNDPGSAWRWVEQGTSAFDVV